MIEEDIITSSKLEQTHDEIRKAYRLIDNEWLKFHFKAAFYLTVFAFFIEAVIGIIVINSEMLHTSLFRYLMKYLVIPSGLNFVYLMIGYKLINHPKISQIHKIYSISGMLTIICFNLFTVHNLFSATYIIFTFSIIMTVLYADYHLTLRMASLSVVLMIISEVFIKWDPDRATIFENSRNLTDFLISVFILAAISMVCLIMIHYEKKKNETSLKMSIEQKALRHSLKYDEMTGVLNRKALHDALTALGKEGNFTNCVLAIVDIDNFKKINDHWGHHFGDVCLVAFAKTLKTHCQGHAVYRYGGDEFCILFEEMTIGEARIACEHVKQKINALVLDENPKVKLSASFGIAEYKQDMVISNLFIQSDNALYKAKAIKNTVCTFE